MQLSQSWRDYGYASMFFNRLPTLHDGGLQATPTTHFVADALLKADIFDSIGTLKFLSTSGHKGINAEISVAGLSEAIKAAVTDPLTRYLFRRHQSNGRLDGIDLKDRELGY